MAKVGRKLKMSNTVKVDPTEDYPVKEGQAVYITLDFNIFTENFKDQIIDLYLNKLQGKGLELSYYEYHDEIKRAEIQLVFTGDIDQDQEDNDEPKRDYSDPDHWNDPNKYRNLAIQAGMQQTAFFTAKTIILVSAITAPITAFFVYLTSMQVEVGDIAENITRTINYGFMALSFYTSYKILDLFLGGD